MKKLKIYLILCFVITSILAASAYGEHISMVANVHPDPMKVYKGAFYFNSFDDASGQELWRSDGTAAGTGLFKDINPGKETSSPYDFMEVNGILYFGAIDDVAGYELWKTDGTEAGTVLVKDIYPGTGSSGPQFLTEYNGMLYFTADNETNGKELWKTDGTEAGTVMIKDIYAGSEMSFPAYLKEANGILYFRATDKMKGTELWRTDGTKAGTVRVKDIYPGTGSSNPYCLEEYNGELYFRATDGVNGEELWKSDGTEAGTVMVKDINPGAGKSSIVYFREFNGELYFKADDGTNGYELWKTDGTETGTVMLKDINPTGDSGTLYGMMEYNGLLYFNASDGTSGSELWETDGTEAGTVMVKDIYPGTGGSSPQYLTEYNGELYFKADNGTNGYELWKTDGTEAGTVMVRDINQGAKSSTLKGFTHFNNALYFIANNGVDGVQLWEMKPTMPSGPVIFVDADALPSGAYDGTSWSDAYTDLQSALSVLTDGNEIWVAEGTYKPTETTDRLISFIMRREAGIYGGFAGTETERDQRDWENNVTILSGDIGIIGNNTDNSYHVIRGLSGPKTSVLDGFTITGGNANGGGLDTNGGGIYNRASNLFIANCIFTGNSADEGGGMANILGGTPVITHCTFSGNTAKNGGGGMYIFYDCDPVMTYCTFSGNTATYGGGIDIEDIDGTSNSEVHYCTFSGNTATSRGGGVYVSSDVRSLTMNNSVLSGNTAKYGGGLCTYSQYNQVSTTNCTFTNNTANNGGGIYNQNDSTIANCILWGNSPNEISGDNPAVNYSIVKGGGFTGTGNQDADPLFVDSLSGNFHLQGASPAIDTGNSAAIPAGVTTDLDDNPRISGTAVDIGAYEFLPAPEISLKQGTTDIASGGSYDFGSIDVGGDSGAITFTIENTGNVDLNLSGTPKIAISGANAADFSVDETSTTASIAASGNTSFTVTFTPSSAGAKTAIISIANNDSDENPYTVTLNGTGTVTPGYASTPVSGSTIDVGTAEIGTSASAILQINETGTAALNITGCTISGANSANFSVSPSSFSIADGGAAQNITIQCMPSAAGTRTATLTVTHNAPGSPATYTLDATGTATPGYASSPVSGSTINVGTATVGLSASASLQISETGTAALNITGCTISGANSADFSVSPETLSIADGGAAQNITIQCTPSATGARTATLTVAHNASGSPVTYTLNCTATESTITPSVTTAEVSGITATEAVSGGEIVYPENCIATLLASGLVWNTVTPAYPEDAHTSAGTEPGSFTGTLTGLLPQTTYYVRAYVQYKLNGVVQILYGDTYELTTAPLPGDVNGDKVLDLKDAIFALKIVSGASGNAEINLPADVNGDGKIGMEEAVYVLQNVGIEG